MNKFIDVDETVKFNILLPIALNQSQFISVQFAIVFQNKKNVSERNNSLAPNLSES